MCIVLVSDWLACVCVRMYMVLVSVYVSCVCRDGYVIVSVLVAYDCVVLGNVH